MYKSQQALLHAKSKLHEQKRRPRDEHHQDGATATPTTSASSPSAIKASSPLDVRHLRLLPTSTPTTTSSSPRRPPTSEGNTSIFGSPSRKMAEHGNFPSVMETSYEVPHHLGLQKQDGDKKVEQGPSSSTTATSTNLFNNMKTTPILDSYSESSYETAHETLSLVFEESDDVPSSAFIHGYDHDMIEHGDICTNISPTTTCDEMSQLPCGRATTT